MLEIWLIRHSYTPGNEKKRYIGSTDEPLSEMGKNILEEQKVYPEVLYCSPMRRCVETADILFPKQLKIWIPELKECDFGEFENKNYLELADNLRYQEWIDSNGEIPFPKGESREEFQERNLRGMEAAIADLIKKQKKTAAFVIHGGSIMNVMEAYTDCEKGFYGWHLQNGEGYQIEIDEDGWKKGEHRFLSYQKKSYRKGRENES